MRLSRALDVLAIEPSPSNWVPKVGICNSLVSYIRSPEYVKALTQRCPNDTQTGSDT